MSYSDYPSLDTEYYAQDYNDDRNIIKDLFTNDCNN